MKDLGPVTLELDEPVVTTEAVADGAERAGLVIHQHNGAWQFIGDTAGTEENVQVLHFGHLLELDASLSQVRRLQPGGLMTRMPIGWATLRFATDEAMDEYLGV